MLKLELVSLEAVIEDLKKPEKALYISEPYISILPFGHYITELPLNTRDLLMRYRGNVVVNVAPLVPVAVMDVGAQNGILDGLTELPYVRKSRALVSLNVGGESGGPHLFIPRLEFLGKIGEEEERVTSTQRPEPTLLGSFMKPSVELSRSVILYDVARIHVKLLPNAEIAGAYTQRLATGNMAILPGLREAGNGQGTHIKIGSRP